MAVYEYRTPRRFPLSRKHRPIRPTMRPRQHHTTLGTRSVNANGHHIRVIDGSAIGGPKDVSYTLESLKTFIIQKHQAENVQVCQHLETDCRHPNVDCTWTAKPRLGQKNRAYLAAHGIKV